MQQMISSKQLITVVSSKGQVTIPIAIRKHLGVITSDKVAFSITDTGEVSVSTAKYPNIAALKGVAGSLKKPLTWKQMQKIARQDALKNGHSK